MKILTERDKRRARQLRDLAEGGDPEAANDIWREFGIRIPNPKAVVAGPTAEEKSNPANTVKSIWHFSISLPHAA